MTEHTSLMIFLASSLTVAWALWVLEGLCPSTMMEFSMEQLYVSTRLWVLMTLSLKVTGHFVPHQGIGLPLGIGVDRRFFKVFKALESLEESGFCAVPSVFS